MPELRTAMDNYSDEYVAVDFDTYCTESDSCECIACMEEMHKEWEDTRAREQVAYIVEEFEKVKEFAVKVDEGSEARARYAMERELEEGFTGEVLVWA